ncbi:MAG: hypothetical protein ACRDK5_11470 [Solirubrobacterales bacterium]
MPLSRDPEKRARQLANLRPAPAAPAGHSRSLVAAPPDECRSFGGDGFMNTAVTDELVEQIARRVVELLREDAPLLDAADVARRLGRSREWVYRHADELGAVRLGDGERPRLGFEPAKVAAFLDACGTGRRTEGPAKPAAKRTMPRVVAPVNGQGGDLLPIRGKAPVR